MAFASICFYFLFMFLCLQAKAIAEFSVTSMAIIFVFHNYKAPKNFTATLGPYTLC